MKRWGLFLLFIVSTEIFAKELRYLMRSPKGMLMGDAYTTLAEDDFSLFYNPALLTRNSGLTLFPINPQVSFTNPIGEQNRIKNFPSDPVLISNRVMGFPLHGGAGIAPGFKLYKFGLSGFSNFSTNVEVKNKTHPTVTIDHHLDQGFASGFAFNFWKNGKSHLAAGIGFKYIKRTSIDQTLPLFGTTMLNLLESNPKQLSDVVDKLETKQAKAVGYDAGIDWVLNNGISQFAFGAAVLDIGDTKFSGNDITKQSMNITAGTSFKMDFKIIDFSLAADIHQINQGIALQRKLHFGGEVGTPIFRFFAGHNAGYLSYGATLNAGLVKIVAGFYGIEVGSAAGQEQSKRVMLGINLFNFSIDP